MTTDPGREAFEKWFVKHQQAEHPGISVAEIRNHDLERCRTGDYCSESSQTALAAWQAAMAHKSASALTKEQALPIAIKAPSVCAEAGLSVGAHKDITRGVADCCGGFCGGKSCS